jgi:hypothetical protein
MVTWRANRNAHHAGPSDSFEDEEAENAVYEVKQTNDAQEGKSPQRVEQCRFSRVRNRKDGR